MVKLKQVQAQAHKFYFQQWQGNEQPSPAFGGEIVYVTRRGWRHIIYDKKRPKNQVVSRLEQLKTAKRILETKRTVDGYRQKDDFEFWFLRSVRAFGNSL
jgi:hypothetical protein